MTAVHWMLNALANSLSVGLCLLIEVIVTARIIALEVNTILLWHLCDHRHSTEKLVVSGHAVCAQCSSAYVGTLHSMLD